MSQPTVAVFEPIPIGSTGTKKTNSRWPSFRSPENETFPQDHFVTRNGVEFAGTHLILDLWDARQLDDIELMEHTLRQAVVAAGATLLHIHLHHFTPEGGISGVVVLAESHISVHTWPERSFAAFDVFMCGNAEPGKAIETITRAFAPGRMTVQEHFRGVVSHDETICRDTV